jgi:outer membrane receptor protein involved in Fe transport
MVRFALAAVLSWLLFDPSIVLGEEPALTDDAAEEEEGLQLAPMVVKSLREVTAASDSRIQREDFLFLPRQTPSDLLRLVPGIHVQQHTGGGKAHQIFLRGFDAEHGQDLAGYLDGAPLNEVSQVHGQGYLDLHFLIPEVLSTVRISKGGYEAQYGNFATAGTVDFIPRYKGVGNFFSMSVGSFSTIRSLFAATVETGESVLVAALERQRSEGFTRPGDMDSVRAFGSFYVPVSKGGFVRGYALHYDSDYGATDVVPLSLVEEGLLGRFRSIDPTNGGSTMRDMGALTAQAQWGDVLFRGQAYLCYKKTHLFSNYTFFLFDPVNGDQHGLFDERTYGGFKGTAALPLKGEGFRFDFRAGAEARLDRIHLAQTNAKARESLNRIYRYRVWEAGLGAFVQGALRVGSWLKLAAGIRADAEVYDVEGEQDAMEFDIYTNTWSRHEDAPREGDAVLLALSPKASVIVTPIDQEGAWNRLRFFVNFGMGYVTPRAQSMVNFEEESMPRTYTGECAMQVQFLDRALTVQAVAWWADKDQELVFEPESGMSQNRGSSRRYGLEVEARCRPLPWLHLRADVYWSRAFFVDTDEAVPGTPEITFLASVSARHPSGWRVFLSSRYMGTRPLAVDVRSRPYWDFDLGVACAEKESWEVRLDIENLFDVTWNDTTFYYETRPDPDKPATVSRHITPGHPFTLKLSLTIFF